MDRIAISSLTVYLFLTSEATPALVGVVRLVVDFSVEDLDSVTLLELVLLLFSSSVAALLLADAAMLAELLMITMFFN